MTHGRDITAGVFEVCEGIWEVFHDGEYVGTYFSQREAWRAYDRQSNEPISKAEDRSDWSFRKSADAI